MNVLTAMSDLASVATAIVAVWAYGSFRFRQRQIRLRIEKLLRDTRVQKLVPQIAAELLLTKEEAFAAARKSHVLVNGMNSGSGEMLERMHFSYDFR